MSFLSRYQNGECEQIWAEMLALGESVQEEPWYSDAMAVARETMRCARQNIELQIDRLNSLGYRFGYDWWDAEYREMLEDNPPPPVFAAPRPDVLNQLAQVEA